MDTPGIGGSGEVTKKLIDYLPNAVSFIFVINVGSAGGMQNDRVSMLYQPNYVGLFQVKIWLTSYDKDIYAWANAKTNYICLNSFVYNIWHKHQNI